MIFFPSLFFDQEEALPIVEWSTNSWIDVYDQETNWNLHRRWFKIVSLNFHLWKTYLYKVGAEYSILKAHYRQLLWWCMRGGCIYSFSNNWIIHGMPNFPFWKWSWSLKSLMICICTNPTPSLFELMAPMDYWVGALAIISIFLNKLIFHMYLYQASSSSSVESWLLALQSWWVAGNPQSNFN